MQIADPGSSRPEYYDRNPLSISKDYSSVDAPAGATVRWTYTVPANRKAFVEVSSVSVVRMTAGSASAQAFNTFQYLPLGGTANPLLRADVLTNGVGDQAGKVVASVGLMQATDVLRALTGDGSTGGTCQFDASAKATEFDA